MRALHCLLVGVFLSACLAGCGAPAEGPLDRPAPSASAQGASRPAEPAPPTLTELLARPRAELAGLAERWTEKVQRRRSLYRQGQLHFELLPRTRLPLAVPGLRQARYSEKAGFSLPPYYREGDKDSALALHLARLGDAEAARKLIDPTDREALDRLEQVRPGRNYPVEWTRLAGLMLYHAEFGVAAGDPDAPEELLRLHYQAREALDAKAQAGPLGAALLPRGWAVLREAIAAWRPTRAEFAANMEKLLAAWGQAPACKPALLPGAARAEVARLLGVAADRQGAMLAPVPLRALDLLELPLPDDGADILVVCFDERDSVDEFLVCYGCRVLEDYPGPEHLAHLLEEASPGTPLQRALPRRSYNVSGIHWEVTFVPAGQAAGAVARIGKTRRRPLLARDLGPVHLDRSYSQNRLRLRPDQPGARVAVNDPKVLAHLRVPVPPGARAEALLQRQASADAVASLNIRYSRPAGPLALGKLCLPFWQAVGSGEMLREGQDLVLCWQDEQTRYALRVPDAQGSPPELEVSSLNLRPEQVRRWDLQERRQRLQQGKPQVRLPRGLEFVQLGQPAVEVLAGLPTGEGVNKRQWPGGLLVTFVGQAPGEVAQVRELVARFDEAGKATLVRIHYADPLAKRGATKRLLESLRKRYGVPDEPPPGTSPAASTWEDDRTFLACDHDGAGLDVTLADRPANRDDEGVLPVICYLPQGPEGCVLGTARSALGERWKVGPEQSGVVVLSPPGHAPYDSLKVWLDRDRVVRVVARHREPGRTGTSPEEAGKAVADAWGHMVDLLGWPRRQEVRKGAVRAWSTQDDATAVRLYWEQDGSAGTRLYTEWTARGRP